MIIFLKNNLMKGVFIMIQKIYDLTVWSELYKAAIEFRDAKPWNWMDKSIIFGIQNPLNEEIGYCSILGKKGDSFSLVVMRGADALRNYIKLIKGKIKDGTDEWYDYNELIVAYVNPNDLLEGEIELIKQLHLEFNGLSSYPAFRSTKPAYYPWYINEEEAKYLTICLKQAKEIALNYRKNPRKLISPEKETYLVRLVEKKENGYQWVDKWIKLPPKSKKEIKVEILKEEHLNFLEKIATVKKATWEIDAFYSRVAMQPKDYVPYYPRVILCLDGNTGDILGLSYMEFNNYYGEEVIKFFLKIMANKHYIPSEIKVRKKELYLMLEPLINRFNVNLHFEKNLKIMDLGIETFHECMSMPI